MARTGPRLALAALVLLGTSSLGLTAAGASGPSVSISAASAKSGATVRVSGTGFSPLQNTSVSVCGADGRDGSAGCDLRDQVTLLTDNFGRIMVPIRVGIPPVPCPCAVVIDTGDNELVVPISIVGAKVVRSAVHPVVGPPVVKVSAARLDGQGPWTSWLGGPARRTLVFTVHNAGPGSLASAPLVLQLHSALGGNVTVDAPQSGVLGAGQSRTYRVPVDLGPFAVGQYTIHGQIESFGYSTDFRARSFAFPWLLLAGVMGLVQAVLLLLRNRVRDRLLRRDEDAAPDHREEIDLRDTGDRRGSSTDGIELRSAVGGVIRTLLAVRQGVLELASNRGDGDMDADLVRFDGALERDTERLWAGYRRMDRTVGSGSVRLEDESVVDLLHEYISPLELLAFHVVRLVDRLAGEDEERARQVRRAALEVLTQTQTFLPVGPDDDSQEPRSVQLTTPDGQAMLVELAGLLTALTERAVELEHVVVKDSVWPDLVKRWERLELDRAMLELTLQSVAGTEGEMDQPGPPPASATDEFRTRRLRWNEPSAPGWGKRRWPGADGAPDVEAEVMGR